MRCDGKEFHTGLLENNIKDFLIMEKNKKQIVLSAMKLRKIANALKSDKNMSTSSV